jgi:hypothetical protein
MKERCGEGKEGIGKEKRRERGREKQEEGK